MIEIEVKTYAARPGAHINDEDAQVIGPELERIQGSAPEIVEDAAAPSSPLHPYFEWDNDIAGPLYRETQARRLARSVTVKLISRDEEVVQTTPAFVAVAAETAAQPRRYLPVEVVKADADMSRTALADARREFISRARKYEVYRTLFQAEDPKLYEVIEAIDRLQDEEDEEV